VVRGGHGYWAEHQIHWGSRTTFWTWS
jgi:hypothetical protein